jgi:hypothetical protein
MGPPMFSSTRFILCEGPDDKHFLEVLIKSHNLPNFQVCHAAEFNGWKPGEQPTGGKNGFKSCLDRIDVLSGFDDLKAVLIVTDNDEAKSLRALRKSLKRVCSIPNFVTEVGRIYGKPLAVFLVPSATEIGDLETFCLPEVHRVWPRSPKCVEDFLTNTGALSWTKQSSINKARSRAAIVGFYQPEPYMGLGYLFQKGQLSVNNPRFTPLVDFLRNFDTFVGI